LSSGVVKKRWENAGPVGDVEVCADAAVAIVPASEMTVSARIDLRM
jgi:hypothetical protein